MRGQFYFPLCTSIKMRNVEKKDELLRIMDRWIGETILQNRLLDIRTLKKIVLKKVFVQKAKPHKVGRGVIKAEIAGNCSGIDGYNCVQFRGNMYYSEPLISKLYFNIILNFWCLSKCIMKKKSLSSQSFFLMPGPYPLPYLMSELHTETIFQIMNKK